MKRTILLFSIVTLLTLTGCTSTSNPQSREIEIGYNSSGGAEKPFPGFLAFTVLNSVSEQEGSVSFIFEYGHDYDSDEYTTYYSTHSLAVFFSESTANHYRSNGEFTTIFEEEYQDFVSDKFKCEVDRLNIFSRPIFSKSFELEISSTDIPYEIGMLYFVLSNDVFSDEIANELPIVYQVIYFTNKDGILIFTEDNPFNDL